MFSVRVGSVTLVVIIRLVLNLLLFTIVCPNEFGLINQNSWLCDVDGGSRQLLISLFRLLPQRISLIYCISQIVKIPWCHLAPAEEFRHTFLIHLPWCCRFGAVFSGKDCPIILFFCRRQVRFIIQNPELVAEAFADENSSFDAAIALRHRRRHHQELEVCFPHLRGRIWRLAL